MYCTGASRIAIFWKVSVINVTLPDATGMSSSVIPYVPDGELLTVRTPEQGGDVNDGEGGVGDGRLGGVGDGRLRGGGDGGLGGG